MTGARISKGCGCTVYKGNDASCHKYKSLFACKDMVEITVH
jgi:hypothetical protein